MKNFVTVTIAIFICLTIGVESEESQEKAIMDQPTPVKLRWLAERMCKRDTVRYYRDGYKKFCELSKKFICPETGNTPDAKAAKCIPTIRMKAATVNVHRHVCLYTGNDVMTKKVQALQQDGGQCIFHEFYGD